MRAKLTTEILDTARGRTAESIIRACVHCGFCNATCPTYQLLGDELDGPRGRIYLIKSMLEGNPSSARTQAHLDRCLMCRACETTCPSGVEYGRLAEFGRELLESRIERTLAERLKRRLLGLLVPYHRRFGVLLAVARAARPLLPARLRRRVPARRPIGASPAPRHRRRLILLPGCVQRSAAPEIDAAAARVFDHCGWSLVTAPDSGCCGALPLHLGDRAGAVEMARRNIDACWSLIEEGAEGVVTTASGCELMFRDYTDLLGDDAVYGARAGRLAALTRDPLEIVEAEIDTLRLAARARPRTAFHAPCTLQHGLRLAGRIEGLLQRLGFDLCHVGDAHLCCGSAGTYSLLQPALSERMLTAKLATLQHEGPDVIATANIGCLLHLARDAAVPVRHWLEVVADELA